MIRIMKTVTSAHWPPKYPAANASVRPTTSPPSIAPGMLPIPPTTAAVKPFSPARNPMKWNTWLKSKPNITPAAPARNEPKKKVDAITRSVSMPIIDAASRSYDVARIALPTRVRATRKVSRIISATVIATTITWTTWIGMPCTVNTGSMSGPGRNSSGSLLPSTNEL